jgi:hypothetical protein
MHKSIQLLVPLALTLAICGAGTGCSPYNKVRLKAGSFDLLKPQTALNVEYDYQGLRIGRLKKKSVPEQECIDARVAELNARNAGTGDLWRHEWFGNRSLRYHPKFEALLNKQLAGGKTTLISGAHPDAPYTLVLKVQYLEPGWHVGIAARPALLTSEAVLVETRDRARTVATVSLINMVGMDAWGMAYDGSWRIQESYAKSGKELGSLIRKTLR